MTSIQRIQAETKPESAERTAARMDESEFLSDPAEAFRAADRNGSVVVTRSGAPRFVLTIPATDMNLD